LEPRNRAEILFAKLYEGEEGAQAVRVATWVTERLAESGTVVTGVRPRAYVAADAVILYPQVVGTPVSGQLHRPGREVAAHLEQAGRALAALHGAPAPPADALSRHSFAAEVKGIARTCEHIQVLLPEVGAQISRLLDCAQEQHSRMEHESPTFVHGDFKADHLWITPAGLTLIDFDTCTIADPALDVGKFLADLDWWYAAYDLPGVEAAQECFLKGYAARGTPGRQTRARIYEALVLVKMTAHRVRLFDPNWAARTAQLIERAEAILRIPVTP
jgi:aminoglycoside phosphotransferase (APT) family kinase protein